MTPRDWRWLGVAVLAASVAGAAPLMPRSLQATRLLAYQDDPDSLSRLRLAAQLDAPGLARDLATALEVEDFELAESYVALALQTGLAVPADLARKLEEAQRPGAVASRKAGEFIQGAVSGEADSDAALVGAIAADLSGLGDVRDLVIQARKLQQGEEPDRLVVALAAIGLTVTGATIMSLGAAVPARAGVSTVKVAARSGRLSRPLMAEVTRISREAVDTDRLRQAAQAARTFDLPAMRAAASASLRPGATTRLVSLAGDTAAISGKAGARTALEALSLSRSSDDLARIASLSAKRGPATRAILKRLGLGAIAITSAVLTLAGWAMSGLLWVFAALLLVARMLKGTAGFVARRLPPYRDR